MLTILKKMLTLNQQPKKLMEIDISQCNKSFIMMAGLISQRDGITFAEAIVKIGNELASKAEANKNAA